MKVDIWSDIRCPFCYVGKKNFEKGLAQFADKDKITVTWHSFQLDPNLKTEPDVDPLQHFAQRKGVTAEQAKLMHEHAKNAGKSAGIDFNFEGQKVANSFKGHLLIQFAQTKNLANEAEEALFKAQFIDGKNIDDEDTLAEIGKSISLNEDEVRSALHSEDLAYAVTQDMQKAQQMGIHAVPFFVFNDKYGVSGAQPAHHFTEVLQKSWTEFSAGDTGLHIIHNGESCDVDGNCD